MRLLFATRITRMFAYGLLSVVLALYLVQLGLTEPQIGLLFSLTLAGDAIISLWITTNADRIGRKRMLMAGATLMVLAGVAFAITNNYIVLTLAAIIGVISPSGKEVGPFLAIEQAALTQLLPNQKRTQTFAWYNLAGSFATAAGALAGGGMAEVLQNTGTAPLSSYRVLVVTYGLLGLVLMALFARATSSVEVEAKQIKPTASTISPVLGLTHSRNIVLKLSALFALDALGGSLVLDSFVALWLFQKFGMSPAQLGSIFFATNILAGISALSASSIAKRIGLINTMVFTHVPSNILLMLVPLMPSWQLAVALLLARFSISQMDVPTRQSYTMAVVQPEERSAAAGVTSIARSVGSTIGPTLTGLMLRAGAGWLSAPFFIAGALKIMYDLALYRSFVSLRPDEEKRAG